MHRDPATCRILIVDDNRDAADLLKMLLDLDSYEVSVAYSGEEGLTKAVTSCPHIIFSELHMRGMSGLEFARRVRRQPQFCNILMVALSGWTNDVVAKEVKQAGFDCELRKPLLHDDLRECIYAYLKAGLRRAG